MKKLMLATSLCGVVLIAGCTGGSAGDSSVSTTSAAAPQSSAATTPPASPSPTATPTPTPTGPVELTIEEAGVRYLEAVCPSNEAEDAYREAYEENDAYVSVDQAPSKPTRMAAKAAAAAEIEAAQELTDPEIVWPQQVRSDIKDVATQLYEFSSWYTSIAKADAWSDVGRFPKVSNKDAASSVRLLLDLPPRGKCPKEYRD